jgi:hypothetical protein
MTTTITTVTITAANNPYTLSSADQIVIPVGANDTNNAGEAIYTAINNARIVNLGTILDQAYTSTNSNEYGVQSRGDNDVLDNFGAITATTLTAVGWNDGTISNASTGVISGGTFGIKIGGGSLTSTIINAGTITGKNEEAIFFATYSAPGIITNTGYIGGDTAGGSALGVDAESGIILNSGTVINAGTISQGHAGGYSVLFTGTSFADSLVLDPGEVEKGIDKTAGTLGSFITLAGTTLGTLSNPGNYVGWTLASVAAGADWKIGGTSVESFGAGLGTIAIAHGAGTLGGGTLTLSGSLDSSTGAPITINMGGNATGFGNGSTLNLTGSFLPNDSILANPITNFGSFDTIILPGFTPSSGDTLLDSYNTGTGILSVYEASEFGNSLTFAEAVSLSIAGPAGSTLNTGNFNVFFNNHGLIITDAPCFAAGTRILTPDGEVAVEDIVPGQEVLTAREGSETVAEVIWTGHRTIDLARHAMPEKVRPVRILAGAFGPGLPERDLRVSPDHALYIDGHLIEAKTLVNGVTVIVEKSTRYVTYHHIELKNHDVVLAEGLPAETYLESGNRLMFESDAQPMVLHPDFAAVSRKNACAPLLTDGRIVTAARQRLLDRALALGFAVTGDVDLVVRAGLERIKPEPDQDGELLFVLPAGAKDVQLLSGTGVPAEVSADPGDRRVLGVAVSGLTLIANGKRMEIALNDAAHDGFHDMEAGHRWTKGAARISLPPYSGRAVLEVTIHGQARRWSSVASRQSLG